MFIIVLVIVVLLQLISSSYSIKQISYGRHSTAHSIVLDLSKKENKEKLLKGQTFIVTGGNIGIGLATVKALAFAGARVILCSRDIKKGNEAIKNEINKKDYGNYIVEDTSNIIVKELDLASFQSIKKFTKDIIKKEKKINCLILNAGIMALPKLILHPETNCELQMATNHIGHAAVIRLLLPKLKNDARIVILSSSAHRFGTKDIMKDLSYKQKLYLPWVAYGQSKGLSKHLCKKGREQMTICSVHPGVITSTQLFKQSIATKIFSKIFPGDRNTAQGAASTIWACLMTEPERIKGAYIFNCKETTPNANGRNEKLRDDVFKITEKILDEKLQL